LAPFIRVHRTMLVLCLNLGRTYTFGRRRKNRRAKPFAELKRVIVDSQQLFQGVVVDHHV
jgi:hypothetical protein